MQTVNEAVDKMLKADIIEESSGSWAFPIVIVIVRKMDQNAFA